MKPMTRTLNKRGCRCRAALLGLILPAFGLLAADTNAPQATAPVPQTNAPVPQATTPASKPAPPAPEATAPAPLTPEQMFEGGTNSFSNWIDLSAGGFMTSGNQAQFQQRHETKGGAFGGVEDFHYQADLAKGTTMTADGHAIFDNDDYKLSLGVTREKLGSVGLEPACIKACPTGCLHFGTKPEMKDLAEKRAAQLRGNSGYLDAGVYDPPGVGGTGVIYVLHDAKHPELYGGLPSNPRVPILVQLWKKPLRWVGNLGMLVGVFGVFIHYLRFGPKIVKEDEPASHGEAQ